MHVNFVYDHQKSKSATKRLILKNHSAKTRFSLFLTDPGCLIIRKLCTLVFLNAESIHDQEKTKSTAKRLFLENHPAKLSTLLSSPEKAFEIWKILTRVIFHAEFISEHRRSKSTTKRFVLQSHSVKLDTLFFSVSQHV